MPDEQRKVDEFVFTKRINRMVAFPPKSTKEESPVVTIELVGSDDKIFAVSLKIPHIAIWSGLLDLALRFLKDNMESDEPQAFIPAVVKGEMPHA